MVQFVKKKLNSGTATLEAHDMCVRYNLNNVASCAFGLEAECFEKYCPMFRTLAKDFVTLGTWNALKLFLVFTLPSFSKILRVK